MNENFKEIINKKQPVLVVFYAEWCGHCQKLAPVLEEVSTEIADKARIEKIDIDKNQELASEFQVPGVPTLILFKNGEAQWRKSGALPKEQLMEVINQHV